MSVDAAIAVNGSAATAAARTTVRRLITKELQQKIRGEGEDRIPKAGTRDRLLRMGDRVGQAQQR